MSFTYLGLSFPIARCLSTVERGRDVFRERGRLILGWVSWKECADLKPGLGLALPLKPGMLHGRRGKVGLVSSGQVGNAPRGC